MAHLDGESLNRFLFFDTSYRESESNLLRIHSKIESTKGKKFFSSNKALESTEKIMRVFRQRFLTIQHDSQRRNDTCNEIYITWKLQEILLSRGYSRKILRPEILDLCTRCIPRAESRSNPIPCTYMRKHVPVYARMCMSVLGLAHNSQESQFSHSRKDEDRAIRIAECIRDVRSSVRSEFLYDLWDRKESVPTTDACVCVCARAYVCMRRKNYAHRNQWRAPISSSSRVSIDLSDATR